MEADFFICYMLSLQNHVFKGQRFIFDNALCFI